MADDTAKRVAAVSFPPLPAAKVARPPQDAEGEGAFSDLAKDGPANEKDGPASEEEVMQWRRRKKPTLTEGTVILTDDGHIEAKMPRRKIEKSMKSKLSAKEKPE